MHTSLLSRFFFPFLQHGKEMQLSIAPVPLILPKYYRRTPASRSVDEDASFQLSYFFAVPYILFIQGREARPAVLAAVPCGDRKVQYIKLWVLGCFLLTLVYPTPAGTDRLAAQLGDVLSYELTPSS